MIKKPFILLFMLFHSISHFPVRSFQRLCLNKPLRFINRVQFAKLSTATNESSKTVDSFRALNLQEDLIRALAEQSKCFLVLSVD
jgi:hypothetical protein